LVALAGSKVFTGFTNLLLLKEKRKGSGQKASLSELHPYFQKTQSCGLELLSKHHNLDCQKCNKNCKLTQKWKCLGEINS